MKSEWNDSMAEATRLVNTGDLMAATAMIQRALGNAVPPGAGGGLDAQRDRPDIVAPALSPVRDYLDGVFERLAPDGTDTPAPQPHPAPAGDAPRANERSPDGRCVDLSYRNAAGTRAYKLYVPAGDAAAARPLIVMLHGCTQGPDDFAAGTRMNALADRHGFLVAWPAQPQSANNSKCWNWFNTSDQHRDRGEPSLIAGIVGDIRSRHNVDADRIHIVGFSAGAAMAVVMAAEYPDLFASAAIHSGLGLGVAHDIPSALAVMRGGPGSGGPLAGGLPGGPVAGGSLANGLRSRGPLAGAFPAGSPLSAGQRSQDAKSVTIPAIVFHGDRDTLVHPRNGEHIVQQWKMPAGASPEASFAPVTEQGQGPGGRPYTRRILHGTTEQPLLEHWRVHGGGHGWFGGSPAGSHTDPKGPDASSEIVRFFGQNPRRPGTNQRPASSRIEPSP